MKRFIFLLLMLTAAIFICVGYNAFIMAQNESVAISKKGGNAGNAGSPSNPAASGSAAASNLPLLDWTMYHNDNARTGFVANAPDPQKLTSAWQKTLDGAVYAEPLVIGGQVIVATEGDTIYSLDARTGQEKWHQKIGDPVQGGLPCGNIFPLGITGTPVYDPATKLVFAVAEIAEKHTLVGLDIGTGTIKVQRSADVPSMEPRVHQQRPALALYNNMVYIAYGGLSGDCGNYHGTIVASQTDGQGPLLSFSVPTSREGGIWATPGPVIDAQGNLYVAVGNGEENGGDWTKSLTDSVLRLSPQLKLEDGFAPKQWGQDNDQDADLGSMGPVLLANNQIFSAGKSSRGYLLDANKLGGVGGQLLEQDVCVAFGGSATTGNEIYVPCTNGLRQLKIGPGNTINKGWQAQVNGSPIIAGHTVYSVNANGGQLFALDSQTGNIRAQANVGKTSRFATPTYSGNFIFVGTLNGISAVTIS